MPALLPGADCPLMPAGKRESASGEEESLAAPMWTSRFDVPQYRMGHARMGIR
jgi:hypothetical protein